MQRHILTRVALIEKSVITVTRLIVDQDSLIRKFKGKVMQNITDSDVKQQLQDAIRKIKFESRVDAVKPAFAYARNNYLAHLDVENNLTASSQSSSPSIGFDEVDEAVSITIDLFNLLCFETGFYLWQIDYAEARRNSETTDIDILLHELAQGSHILHMPEDHPEMWVQLKVKYSADEIAKLNEYRSKFNLPEMT